MKTMLKTLAFSLAVIALTACYDTKEAAAPSPENYAQLKTEATSAIDKAQSVGFEWRDSRKFLSSADTAAKGGDYTKAMQLAMQAKSQGEMAYQQYLDQKNAGPH